METVRLPILRALSCSVLAGARHLLTEAALQPLCQHLGSCTQDPILTHLFHGLGKVLPSWVSLPRLSKTRWTFSSTFLLQGWSWELEGEDHAVVWVGRCPQEWNSWRYPDLHVAFLSAFREYWKNNNISFRCNTSEAGEQSRAHILGGASEETEII